MYFGGFSDCQYGEDEDNCPSTTSTTTTARSIGISNVFNQNF